MSSLATFASITFFPVLFPYLAFDKLFQWQREHAKSMTRLLTSVSGVEVLDSSIIRQHPQDADLFIGKSVSHTKTLTDADTVAFGLLSLDFNPLHFNEALARCTRFQGRIAHGFHTASLFSGVLAELTPWCVYFRQEIDFTAPVRPGDRITARGIIEEIDTKGMVHVSLTCINQKDETVVRGNAVVKKLKEIYQATGFSV